MCKGNFGGDKWIAVNGGIDTTILLKIRRNNGTKAIKAIHLL